MEIMVPRRFNDSDAKLHNPFVVSCDVCCKTCWFVVNYGNGCLTAAFKRYMSELLFFTEASDATFVSHRGSRWSGIPALSLG